MILGNILPIFIWWFRKLVVLLRRFSHEQKTSCVRKRTSQVSTSTLFNIDREPQVKKSKLKRKRSKIHSIRKAKRPYREKLHESELAKQKRELGKFEYQ